MSDRFALAACTSEGAFLADVIESIALVCTGHEKHLALFLSLVVVLVVLLNDALAALDSFELLVSKGHLNHLQCWLTLN